MVYKVSESWKKKKKVAIDVNNTAIVLTQNGKKKRIGKRNYMFSDKITQPVR